MKYLCILIMTIIIEWKHIKIMACILEVCADEILKIMELCEQKSVLPGPGFQP